MVLDAARGERAVRDAAPGVLAVGLEAALHVSSQERTELGVLAFLQVPLDRLGAPRRRDLLPSPVAETPRAPDGAPAPPPAGSEPAAPLLLSPDLARGAVRAACRAAKLDDAESRLDALASRARTSALLPELRLRATRAVDESESLAPTEYDPLRRTATGGASTWLEARATFRLDRLVFADDELAVERLRIARAAERSRLVAKVLDLLDAWQLARAAEADPAAEPIARQRASLAAASAEASLDVLTGGWFSKALRARGAEARAAADPDRAEGRAEGRTGCARDRARSDGGRGAGDACAPGDTPDTGAARSDGESGPDTRDANERARDANDHTRRAATRDPGAAAPPHDAPHPSAEWRSAPRKNER